MSESRPDLQTWAAGLLFLWLAGFVGYSLPRPESSKTAEISMAKDTNAADKGAQAKQVFTPPRDDQNTRRRLRQNDQARLGYLP